jgi:hypothetical protein
MRNKYATIWIWLLMCPLALDYKASANSDAHGLQIMLTVPPIIAALMLWLIAPSFTRRSRFRSIITGAIVTTVVGSIVAQLLQDNDVGNYMRTLLPFGLFLLGYLAACRPWDASRLLQFEKAFFWAMLISLVFAFTFGLTTVVGPLEDVRYRLVSDMFLGMQAVLLHQFVVAKRYTKVTLAVFAFTLVIELLSFTRSLLVGTALLFVFATFLSAPSARHMLKAGVRALMLAAAIAGVLAVASTMMPEVAAHWTERIFASKGATSGRDPTTITRLAEMKDQYDQVTATPGALILGKGYGAIYHYSPDYLPDLAGQITAKDFYAIREFTAGHNFWVYQLFAGGLLFGLGLPLAVLLALGLGAVAYREWRRRAPDLLYLPVMGRSLLLLAALPATSIGGNPLGPRFSGLLFGVALGLLVATYTRLSYAMKVRSARQTMRGKRRPGRPAARPVTPITPATPITPITPVMPMPMPSLIQERHDGNLERSRFNSA